MLDFPSNSPTLQEANVIGSGLLAKAFLKSTAISSTVCIYAAGVSNSSCINPLEFEREQQRLTVSLKLHAGADSFVYFSTCSIAEPEVLHTPYIKHKLAMEKIVAQHPNYLIARLPQLAGKTSNPHTLLNYVYKKINSGEKFVIWKNTKRNIIDVDDVVAILSLALKKSKFGHKIINIANPISHSMEIIVATMEQILAKSAHVDFIDKTSSYDIDITAIQQLIGQLDYLFDHNYLARVLQKYYGQGNQYDS